MHGVDDARVLPDGRVVEFWDGGDPHGRPVLMHPGTPATRVLGVWGHWPAVRAGLRLIAVNRPGYGGSTRSPDPPSLSATGHDTAALAACLDLDEYAVLGISGGGPFALATAVAAPAEVRVLCLVGAVGPWRALDEPSDRDAEDRALLARLDAGDCVGARDGMRRAAERDLGPLRRMDDDARVDAILDGPASPLTRDEQYRALWAANMAVLLDAPDGLDGYVEDNLAWGAAWDADPLAVSAPTLVWDGDGGDDARHGRWYADSITGSSLVVHRGEGHVDVCDGHWPEVLAALTSAWG